MSVSSVAVFVLGWTFLSWSVAQPLNSDPVVFISTCFSLRHALGHPTEKERLVLTQSLRCDANEWHYPVPVVGQKTLQSQQGTYLVTLDLSDLNGGRGVIVEPNSQLTLDRLVLADRSRSNKHGFKLSYARIRHNATISISRSFISYPLCISTSSGSSVMMKEGDEGRYQVCGTRRLCAQQSRPYVQYIVDDEMKAACISQNSLLIRSFPVDAHTDRPINSQAVLVALFCLVLGFTALGGVIVWLCRTRENKARVLDTYFHKEEKSSTGSETTEIDFSMSLRLVAFDDFSIDLDQQLGVGGFGTVFVGKYLSQIAAVKVIKTGDMPDGQDSCAEANLAMEFSHPNVIKSYATRQVKIKELFGEQHHQGDDDCTLIFLEHCDKGELSRAIDRGEYVLNFQSLQPKMCAILHCALDIAKGLQYLHSLGVVHGDIKPDNILRKSDELDPRGYICKICDFGLSKKLENMMSRTDTLGMISYMPPEMLRKGRIGKFTDIYSFGMLLWEMVTSDVPYSEVDYNQILSEAVHGRRPAIPDSTPSTIKSLIKSCWISDYSKRPIATDVVRRLHLALSEWYSSFPMNPLAPQIPRWLRSTTRRSGRQSTMHSAVYAESLYSDTALDEVREERVQQSILKSHSTCMRSESTVPDLLMSSTGGATTLTTDFNDDLERRMISPSHSLKLMTTESNPIREGRVETCLTSICVDTSSRTASKYETS